jgi:hypothetical protein
MKVTYKMDRYMDIVVAGDMFRDFLRWMNYQINHGFDDLTITKSSENEYTIEGVYYQTKDTPCIVRVQEFSDAEGLVSYEFNVIG